MSEGDLCALSEAENVFFFLNGNLVIYMGNISKNLDQAMSKKNVAKEEGGGKHKEKKTHSSLGLTGPNFAFGRNF